MSTRSPQDLIEPVYLRWQLWDIAMHDAHLNYILTRVACSQIEQEALFAQGRNPLWIVNQYRRTADLPRIEEAENHKVTWTLESKHIVDPTRPKARAFDFAIKRSEKEIVWSLKVDTNESAGPDYAEAGRIWEKLGGTWGGSWTTHPDPPHCQ